MRILLFFACLFALLNGTLYYINKEDTKSSVAFEPGELPAFYIQWHPLSSIPLHRTSLPFNKLSVLSTSSTVLSFPFPPHPHFSPMNIVIHNLYNLTFLFALISLHLSLLTAHLHSVNGYTNATIACDTPFTFNGDASCESEVTLPDIDVSVSLPTCEAVGTDGGYCGDSCWIPGDGEVVTVTDANKNKYSFKGR